MTENRYAKQYPNESFADATDELGYDLTVEILMMQRLHKDINKTRDNMRELITKFAEVHFDKGVEAGITLGRLES